MKFSPVLKSSKIFLHLRLSSEVIGKSSAVVKKTSAIFEGRRNSLAIFEGLRKSSAGFGNSGSVETKNLTHFTEKKLAGIYNYAGN